MQKKHSALVMKLSHENNLHTFEEKKLGALSADQESTSIQMLNTINALILKHSSLNCIFAIHSYRGSGLHLAVIQFFFTNICTSTLTFLLSENCCCDISTVPSSASLNNHTNITLVLNDICSCYKLSFCCDNDDALNMPALVQGEGHKHIVTEWQLYN